MAEKLTASVNKLTDEEFSKQYCEIISAGVMAVEHHLQTGAEAGEQTISEAIATLYEENPGHHQNLIARPMIDVED